MRCTEHCRLLKAEWAGELRAEGGGKPMALVLASGQRHEQSTFEALTGQGAVKRGGRGRPKLRPKWVVANKGYNSGEIRGYLRR
jgi:hypothetical protein